MQWNHILLSKNGFVIISFEKIKWEKNICIICDEQIKSSREATNFKKKNHFFFLNKETRERERDGWERLIHVK